MKIIQIDFIRLEKRIAEEEIRLQRATNLGQTRKMHFYLGSIYKKHELLNQLKEDKA